jgi:hypothetical protein
MTSSECLTRWLLKEPGKVCIRKTSIGSLITSSPGEHHLCVMGHLPPWKGLSLHTLNAKAGETHYFFVHVVAGGGYNELTLNQVDPDEGKELVARAKFSESHPK